MYLLHGSPLLFETGNLASQRASGMIWSHYAPPNAGVTGVYLLSGFYMDLGDLNLSPYTPGSTPSSSGGFLVIAVLLLVFLVFGFSRQGFSV